MVEWCKLCERLSTAKNVFNGKMSNEFLNVELFDTMFEVEVLMKFLYGTKMWVKHYNTLRPHSALGGKS